MRKPCVCGSSEGYLLTRSGQDVIRCSQCDSYQYCAPRTETGREVRSLRTRDTIKPSKRARILLRDNGTCVICHRSDTPLDTGHLLSIQEGRQLGFTDDQLNDDENLAAMCAGCNSGLTSETVPLRLFAAVLQARLARTRHAS